MSEYDPRPVAPRETGQVPALARMNPPSLPVPPMPWMDTTEKKEGFNFVAFLHSLRRRWLLGTGIGCLVASAIAALLALLVPIKYEAVVTLRVHRHKEEMLTDKLRPMRPVQDYEVEKKTQAFLLKSPLVIVRALRQPGIAQMPIVRDEEWAFLFGKRENPVAWLERQLKVDIPQESEILRLSMRERDPEDLKKLLNAVTDAYLSEFVTGQQVKDRERLEKLIGEKRRIEDDMRKQLKELGALAQQFGSDKSTGVRIQTDLKLQQLRSLESQRATVDQEFTQVMQDLAMLNQKIAANSSAEPYAVELEEVYMRFFPKYQALRQQLTEYEMAATQQPGRSLAGAGAGIKTRLASLQQEMEKFKAEHKQEAIQQYKLMTNRDDRTDQQELSMLQGRGQILQQRRAYLDKQIQVIEQQLSTMGVFSEDLAYREMAVDAHKELLEKISAEKESLEMEVKSKPQIEVLEQAIIPDESNWIARYMQIIAAWMLSLVGTVLGVALWDMQHQRVNNAQEIGSGGEVRVIGSLPQLIGRRVAGLLPMSENGRRSVELSLTRSIDSIRTTLQLAKHSNPYQVIMVSSALGQEGKTTVASQLAVSYARSGRRTLLIDGDVRNPQQHVVLGMPMQQGLCEVLRGEANVNEVLKATPAENLWVLGAGYRDTHTDQYMALPVLPNLIQELRGQFDIIIIDTSPALTNPDAMLIGQTVDAAILSVRRDISRLPKVKEAAERLRSVGIHVVGAIMNGAGMDIRDTELRSPVVPNHPQIEKSVA